MSISHRLVRHGLCAFCVGLLASSASAGLIGSNVLVSNSGARFPDVSFNSVNGTYLVIWTDYNQSPLRTVGRRVDGNGATIGAIFNISDGVSYGMVPAICYNPTNNEWLVTWDDGRGGSDHVYGQRVRGSDGVLLGGNFAIGSVVAVRSCASWSSAQNAYLVVFSDYAEVYGQRVSNTGGLLGGNFNISNDAVFSGLPVVCAGSGGTQYLVTWDYNPSGNLALIRGCRITASTGALLGSPFNITSTNIEDRSCIAYDTVNARYWVQWNQSNPGMSYDQYARFVSTSGTLIGGTIPLLASTDFEGDSQFGGDCAYLPGVNRFWTQGANVGSFMGYGGIEYDNATGTVIGTKTTLGLGDFMIGNCAGDTTLNRYLSCWEGYVGSLIYIHIQLYGSSSPPSQTSVSINLGNTNIEDLMTSPIGGDGDTIGATGIGGRECRRNMDPAANDFYFYFTVSDSWAFQGNKQDVWIYADYWDSGTGSITLQYDAVSNAYKDGGTVLLTNTNTWKTQKWHVTDAYFGNRENNGGDFRIYVGNVVRYLDQSTVNQNTPNTTPPGQASSPSPANGATGVSITPTLTWTAGANATAHNVYFGTTNPPAFIGVQTTTSYTPGTLVNGTTYYWRIDEYRTSGGTTSGNVWSFTTTGGLPGLATNPNPANAATGVSVSPSLSWTAGSGATSHDVRFGTVNPPPFIQNQAGTSYSPGALIGNTTYFWRIDEKNAVGTTTGTVWSFTTTFCFSDAFAYANGNLNGNGSWTGSATTQIQIVSQTVKVNGGASSFDANRTISCTGSGGIIQVHAKVQAGTGALTMWSLWLNDPAGVNICRWYGTGTTATGRIGSSGIVTPAQTLTGGWDNLLVKINTSAKTAEFFFNNVSIGVLDYTAQGAANTLGKVRFERINNSGAAGHFLSFDNLVTY